MYYIPLFCTFPFYKETCASIYKRIYFYCFIQGKKGIVTCLQITIPEKNPYHVL